MHTELYCIIQSATGLMKFGLSRDPAGRIKGLQTGSGYKLNLIFTVPVERHLARDVERRVHDQIGRLGVVRRMVGEWFEVSPPQWRQCVQEFAHRIASDGHDDGDEPPPHYADFLVLVGE